MNSSADSTPAHKPPPGVTSNFTNPESIQPDIIAALMVCLVLTTIVSVIRTYAQISLYKKLVQADYWMISAWAFQAAFVGTLWACLPYGGGHHLWDVTKTNFGHISFLLFINYILYGCAILGPKVAILLQLIDVFVPAGRARTTTARWFYIAAQILVWANIIYYVAHNIPLIVQCNPIAKGWDSSIPGTCIDQVAVLKSSGYFNVVSDILMFLLPLSVVWQLQLPVRTRLQIASAFAIGLFGCIASGVRIYYNSKLSATGDSTWINFQNQCWANAEVTAAMIIASIIIIPRFLRSKGGTTKASYGSSRSGFSGRKQNSKNSQRKAAMDMSLPDDITGEHFSPEKFLNEHRAVEEGNAGDLGKDFSRDYELQATREKALPPPPVTYTSRRRDTEKEDSGNVTRLYASDSDGL